MRTVTGSMSLALPVNDGVVSFDGDLGLFRLTVGGEVLTVNVIVLLTPGAFPSELVWVAIAVYGPLVRVGLACPELHSPPVPVAVALETSVPSAWVPLKIWTVTWVLSLPKPLKDGVVSFDGVSTGFSVTVGEAVLTSKLTGSLLPWGVPGELGWVAAAVNSQLDRAGLALPGLQLPPLPLAVAEAT